MAGSGSAGVEVMLRLLYYRWLDWYMPFVDLAAPYSIAGRFWELSLDWARDPQVHPFVRRWRLWYYRQSGCVYGQELHIIAAALAFYTLWRYLVGGKGDGSL